MTWLITYLILNFRILRENPLNNPLEDSTLLEANPACEQDNNTDLIKIIEESTKPEVSQCQQDNDQS